MNGHEDAWRVPGYTEVRELGTGGSGRVVLARRVGDDFPVAIKYLSDRLRSDLNFVARFRHEARLLAIMRSPHAARLYEYIEGAGGAAIIMELVDGVSLRALLRSEGPTGPEAALVVLKGALLGLAAAHDTGLVHRDFKPENVIVDAEGRSKLVDFGIAIRVGDEVGGAGTPSYMSPEQWSGAPATPATDVYAATIVFFECLTGTRPFQGDTVAAIARHHQVSPPPVEQVAAPLRGLVEHGMAKHPADRPASADAFLAELEAVASTYGPDWEERGRRRLAGMAALLAAAFPLGKPVGDADTALASTALARTRLHGRGATRRAGQGATTSRGLVVKVALGAGVVAAVTGAAAIVVGMIGGTELTANSSTASPEVTLTTDPTGSSSSSAEPDPFPAEDEDEPEESPTPEATAPTPTPTVTATAEATPAVPTVSSPPSATPSPTATRTRSSAPPSIRPSTPPAAEPTDASTGTPEPILTSKGLPRPSRATAEPSSATPTSAPPATRRPVPPRPVPTETATETSTPSDSPTVTEEPTIGISATGSGPDDEPTLR